MRKILLTLVGIVCSLGMWADTKYNSVDGTTVYYTTGDNYAAWKSAGWAAGSASAGTKKVTINPEDDETIDFTSYAGINVKATAKAATFYLTNITELKVYSVNSTTSEVRYIQVSVTPEGGKASVTYTENGLGGTAVTDITGLDKTKNYTVKLQSFKDEGKTGADVYVYALKAYGVSSGNIYPTITTNPVGASYMQNATPAALTVAATPKTEGATLSYQWYSNTSASTEGATAISGATDASYTPSTATIGTTYYYCSVEESDGTVAATTTPVAVSVDGVVGENAIILFSTDGQSDNTGVTLGDQVEVKPAQEDENTTTVDGITFTSENGRVSFGGKYSSSNKGRHIKINVNGNCQITVYGSSNAGSETRHVKIGTILASNEGEIICHNDAKTVTAASWDYVGEAGTVYVFPDQTNFYVYAIKVTYGNTRSFTTSISGENIGTFSAPYNTAIPEGVTAYTAEMSEDNTKLVLTEIADVIPANTGVFIMGEKGSYTFNETTASASATSCLTATSGNSVLATAGNMVLAKYTTTEGKTNAAMLPASDGLVINSYKAYLASASGAKSMAITFADNATAIASVNVANASAKKYMENGKMVIVTPAGKFNAVGAQVK